MYMPSEPHGEGDNGVEILEKLEFRKADTVWRLNTGRHSPVS